MYFQMMNLSLKLSSCFSSLPIFQFHTVFAVNYHKFSFHEKDALKLLKLVSANKKLAIGKIIHAHLIVTHRATEDNVIESNTLINHYSKCGHVHIARKLFDRMRHKNIVSWSALMAGYLHNGSPVEAVRLFRSMRTIFDPRPNEYILATIISCCSKAGLELFKDGIICHGYALKSGFLYHLYVKNALIYMYCLSSDVDAAWRVLESVPGSDAYTYNSLINGLVEHSHVNEALRVLVMMMTENLEWDSVTYVNMFSLCTRIKSLKLGSQVHCRMIITSNVNFDSDDDFIASAIIDMYGKCGNISVARKIFDRQKNTFNVVTWTSILTAYLRSGFFEEVFKLFSNMDSFRVRSNEFTIAVLLKSCAALSVIKQGSSVHGRALKEGFIDHVIVGNGLINMYAKGGNIWAGKIVFVEMMTHRDCKTWNAMINGYAHHGLGKEALGVFEEMLAIKKVPPNYVTFVGVLSACGHLGWVQDGLYYYEKLMKEMGVEPGLEHHTCIVGLLSRAGLLERAMTFMRSAPVRWDVVAWRTLLNSCHVHQKYDLGMEVAEMVMQLDPNDVGTYMLVSNMHAKAKRWDEVANIRKLMRVRNIKKEPGVSWVEMKNGTHVFSSDDCNHPELPQIYEKVRELLVKIKVLGYVPTVASVLHDVEDEHKEDYLSFHSEKLAIAYALMRTPNQDSRIIVIKNLRICYDCHSAIKLIAKVTNREIIVRDVNRFHCFQGGNCSCSDYW